MKTLSEFLLESVEEFVGIHYSHKPTLQVLHGGMYGTGIKGQESKRLGETDDYRLKNRVYFYPKPKQGQFPAKESGLGSHAYEYRSNSLYNASTGDSNTPSIIARQKQYVSQGEHPANAFEKSVLDHGYEGYHTNSMAVVMARNVPVKYVGQVSPNQIGKLSVEHSPQKRSFVNSAVNSSGEHESDLLSPEQISHVVRNRDTIQKVAPSFRQQYGRAVVKSHDVEALDNYFKKQGIPL